MSLKKIIKDNLHNYLNEQKNLNPNLDLTDKDSVISWLEINGPQNIFDDDGNIDWNYFDSMAGDDLETLIYSYMEKYNEVMTEDEVEVYRVVLLNEIQDLDLDNVGIFWSFEEKSAAAYGSGRKFTGNNLFTLTATVKTDDIDWEQGLYSFVSYGKNEFECTMKKGSECLITHINEEELSDPMNGFC